MIRLAISVEGDTEEEFVKSVLVGHLQAKGVAATPIGLGGDVTVAKLASDIARLHWHFDFVTSLVDFYGFRDKENLTRCELERLIDEDVDRKINRSWNQTRVFSYVQRYEFEGLLFSDVSTFESLIDVPVDSVKALHDIRTRFYTPEDINDDKDTAPSKRIKSLIPSYNKVVDGSLLAMEMGLNKIRAECPRFNAWVTRLENLPVTS